MKNIDMGERCPTGITGLDKVLNGGFPRAKTILVRGDFGVGKTILGTQFICNGIEKYNEPGVIVLLEQSVEDYKKDLAAFNFDIDVLQETGKLVLIDESLARFNLQKKQAAGKVKHLPSPQERFMTTKEIVDYLLAVVNEIGAKRILIDNVPALDNLLRRTKSTRDEILYLNYNLKDRDLTSILVSDTLRNRDDDIENYISDGVIVMEYNVAGPDPGRRLYVKKMRGTSHSEEIHSMRFKKGVGIEVIDME